MKSRELQRREAPGNAQPWAEVKGINPARRRVAIINDWGYAVAELIEGVLRVSDVVEGAVETLGPCQWTVRDSGHTVRVCVTHAQVTRAVAALLLSR